MKTKKGPAMSKTNAAPSADPKSMDTKTKPMIVASGAMLLGTGILLASSAGAIATGKWDQVVENWRSGETHAAAPADPGEGSDSNGSGSSTDSPSGSTPERDSVPAPGEDSPQGGSDGQQDHQGSSDRSQGDHGASTSTYIISRGETLAKISAATGVSVDRLVAANDIVNPNLIYAGSALQIPAVTEE